MHKSRKIKCVENKISVPQLAKILEFFGFFSGD